MDDDGSHILILHFPPDIGFAEELARTLRGMLPDLKLVLSDASEHKPILPDDPLFFVLLSSPETVIQATSKQIEELLGSEIIDKRVAVVVHDVGWPASWNFISAIIDLTGWKNGTITRPLSELASILWRTKRDFGMPATAVADGMVLRPDGTTGFNPFLLMKVEDLALSDHAKRVLRDDNVTYVGDIVQQTEEEMLRIRGFSRTFLDDTKKALSELGLRLGLSLAGCYPPDNFATEMRRAEAVFRALSLGPINGGATFEPRGDQLVMEIGGDDSDRAVTARSITQQMQTEVLRKAKVFAEVAHRLDNQPGWDGFSQVGDRLCDLLDRPTVAVPDVLGLLYPAALELGSFLEMDQAILAGQPSYAPPLDAELRRPLADLVRSFAPWLRSFPSAREMDDEAGRFLLRAADLRSTPDVVRAARNANLISGEDGEVFEQLRQAAERGTHQGEKAAGRYKRSATNLVITSVGLIGTFYLGAIASDFSTHSILVQKAGRFLAQAESSLTELVADFPQDLRYSITHIIHETFSVTGPLPQTPTEPVEDEPLNGFASRSRSDPRRRHL